MKKVILSVLAVGVLTVSAQETYQNATLINEDLNGTARYVAMGGAMEALGADISTIATNPAGIGLFRSSQVTTSFGFVSQSNTGSFDKGDRTNISFDQIGIVWSMRSGRKSFFNVAFNYHKSRNFNQIITAANSLGNGSQNIQAYAKGIKTGQLGASSYTNSDGDVVYEPTFSGSYPAYYSQSDEIYNQAVNFDYTDGNYYSYAAEDFTFKRANTGYIGEYDLNLSGNINDRVYLGITFGIHDVHYKAYTSYTEGLVNSSGTALGDVTLTDERKITGTGFDVKAGIIVRPIEDSPFRIGLYVSTPTFYDLTTSNRTRLDNDSEVGSYDYLTISNAYDFELYTPWKFGISLGHTVGTSLALGASYEFADYGSTDTRVKDGDWYYDSYHDDSSSDHEMNSHTEHTLRGVSTLKLGVEYKPVADLALRIGYNYVSPMYESDGMKGYADDVLYSYGSAYESTTDYTNWKSTNRLTLGAGYTYKRFNVDVAYQYSVTKGDFYPFQQELKLSDASGVIEESYCSSTDVKNARHQLLVTLGYRF